MIFGVTDPARQAQRVPEAVRWVLGKTVGFASCVMLPGCSGLADFGAVSSAQRTEMVPGVG